MGATIAARTSLFRNKNRACIFPTTKNKQKANHKKNNKRTKSKKKKPLATFQDLNRATNCKPHT